MVNERGEIEVKKSSARTVANIREWTDAFLVFMSIHLRKFKQDSQDLIQYMVIICEAGTGGLLGVNMTNNFIKDRQ